MSVFVLIGGGSFFVMSSIMGVRLLQLASSHRKLPELALGVAFLIGGTIGGALGQFIQAAPDAIEPATLGALTLVYKICAVLGITLYNTFTWRVFRPNDQWAAALVASTFILGCGGLIWAATEGAYSNGYLSPGHLVFDTMINAIGPLWGTIEAFSYRRMMSRRLELGLADPVIVNRLWLWGCGALCATFIIFAGCVVIAVPPTHLLAELSTLGIGLLGSAASVFYFFAFFPPSAYIDRVRARAAATG